MITITLLGGPRDGEELTIAYSLWQSGHIRMPAPREPIKFSAYIDPVPRDVSFTFLQYVRQRFWQGWGCVTPDWDGTLKTFHAAEPEFKWCYLGNNWTNL